MRVQWQWLIPVGLFILAIVVFANTFNHGMMYSWDDNRYLRENMLLRDGSLTGIWNIFTQYYFAAYIPVTIFSYWIEFNIWGLNPSGYHVVNVFIHAFNGMLVYFLIDQLLHKRWVAVFASVLFIVHPTQVESVAWIAERKNVLAMFFLLLSFLVHIRSARPGAKNRTLVLAWVLYAASVFSKPTVVGVPLLFAFYDYFWAKMPWQRVIRRNIVPLLIAVAGAYLIIHAHDDYGGIKSHRGGSPIGTAQVMMVVFWDYVVALIAPLQLDNFYAYPFSIVQENPLSVILGLLLVLSALAVIVKLVWDYFTAKRGQIFSINKTFTLFAVLWIGLLMAPVVNIIPIAIERADRYMYFPAVVMYALVGLAIERLYVRLKQPTLQYLLLGAVTVVLVGYTFITLQRNMVWTTEGTLWTDHLEKHPESETGWLNLGVFYYNEADFTNAVPAFQRLLDLSPRHFKGNRFMGHINLRQERYADAIPYYQVAAESDPRDPITQNYMALSYFRLSDFPNAVEAYRRAIGMDSSLTEAYVNLGAAALRTGQNDLARQALAVASERRPNDAEVFNNYCSALANVDMTEQAIEACLQAARLDDDNGFYYGRLAHLLLTANRVDDALSVARRAVEYAPGASLSYRVLGDALRLRGSNEEAIAAYRRSLELDPENRRSIDALNALLGT